MNFKIGCFKIGTEHTAHDDAHVEGPHLALVWDFREWIFPHSLLADASKLSNPDVSKLSSPDGRRSWWSDAALFGHD